MFCAVIANRVPQGTPDIVRLLQLVLVVFHQVIIIYVMHVTSSTCEMQGESIVRVTLVDSVT
jgi:hypothetical protein